MKILIEILIGFVILSSALLSKNNNGKLELSSKSYRLAMAVLSVLFIFLLTYKLTEIPIPYHVDEAGMAYDAVNIVRYHYDRYFNRFPVYFINFGSGQSALYIYLTAILIKLFGYSILTVRIPAVLLSVISALVFSLTIRKEHGNTASVLTMFFFCILPFSIMHSRWGLDAYLFFPMLILSCCALNYSVSVKTKKNVWLFFSGCLFGVTLYSYAVSYAILPLFLGCIVIYLVCVRKLSLKNIFAMGVPLFLLALPLMLLLAVNNGYIDEIRTRFFSIPKIPMYIANEMDIRNVIGNLGFGENNYFYNLFVNDHCIYNTIPKFGTLYYVSIPFIVYGMIICVQRSIVCIRRKDFRLALLMSALFFSSLLVTLMIGTTIVWRCCSLYVALIYFLVIGITEIIKKSKAAAFASAAFYIIISICFFRYYFNDFNRDLDKHPLVGSITDLSAALDFAEEVNRYDETIYVLDPHLGYIYVVLDRNIDPVTFNEQKFISSDNYVKIVGKYRFRLDAVMPECIYIFRDKNKFLFDPDDYDFDVKQFGSYTVYYPALQ